MTTLPPPPTQYHDENDPRTWECGPSGNCYWVPLRKLEAMGLAPTTGPAVLPWGPDHFDPTHGPFPRRNVVLDAMTADTWGPVVERTASGVTYLRSPQGLHVVAPSIIRGTSLTRGRLALDFAAAFEARRMRRTNRYRRWRDRLVGAGFACAFLTLASWGLAVTTLAPQAWAAALWFLGSGLLFELAAILLNMLERR